MAMPIKLVMLLLFFGVMAGIGLYGGGYFLGGFGRLFAGKMQFNGDGSIAGGFGSVIPAMLSGLPVFLIAVVVILALSASMSTLSSLVLASSSTLTLDFIQGNIIKRIDEKRQVNLLAHSLPAYFPPYSAQIS